MTTRREFLAAAAFAGAGVRTRAAEKRAPIVDTHLHCFAGKKDARFPYHKDAPYSPEEAATPEHLLKCMNDAGVDFAVVVHPEPYQDDHRYLEHCLSVGKDRLKGTCLFFAGRADNAKRASELAGKVPLAAMRVHAYKPDRLPPFGKPELRDLWKLADELGLAMQLHFEPRFASGFEPYIREFTKVRVFIDHLGRPMQGTPREHAEVLDWAKHAHVLMKFSAVPDGKGDPPADPGPVMKKLLDAFGPDRLMYGGGFDAQATGKTYRAERERILAFLGDLKPGDRDKILGVTAAKAMGFRLG